MVKLAAVTCETAKPDSNRDRLIGDSDELFSSDSIERNEDMDD